MTAYVERVNLTLRQHIPPLARRTWSLACDEHSLWAYLDWGRAYYHFCRYHEALPLTGRGPPRYRSRTPAMPAGLALATVARQRATPDAAPGCLTAGTTLSTWVGPGRAGALSIDPLASLTHPDPSFATRGPIPNYPP